MIKKYENNPVIKPSDVNPSLDGYKVVGVFDPRRDARFREYKYYVINGNYLSVFLKNYSVLVTHKLNLRLMKKAAKLFIGEKDFASFASPNLSGENTVRRIYSFNIRKNREGLLEFKVVANSFLYNMVRIMIGTILDIEKGERKLEEIKQALGSGNSNFASSMAPARGLFLTRVVY